jgi:hypothetical protein
MLYPLELLNDHTIEATEKYSSGLIAYKPRCVVGEVDVAIVGDTGSGAQKMDRLDVAGGLTPGLSEPGNKESTGNLIVQRKRLPQRYLQFTAVLCIA